MNTIQSLVRVGVVYLVVTSDTKPALLAFTFLQQWVNPNSPSSAFPRPKS